MVNYTPRSTSISNAIKYTKKGGITVRLYEKEGMGVIEVSDTGEGMSPKMLETLFSRSGIKKSNTDAENSSGLGLYIAKNFMQMQGGDITVTSKVGKGTTFAYTLKLATEKNIENFKTHKDVQDNELSDEANGEKTQNPVY